MRTNRRFDQPIRLGDFEKYKVNLVCQKCSNPYGSIVPVTNFEDQYQKDQHQKNGKENTLKEVIAYKYSGNGKYQLHESVILNGIPCFISYDSVKQEAVTRFEIEEQNRIIRPPTREECPFPPYEFDNESELNDYIIRAKQINSIAELFNASKYFWTLYIDQDAQIITILAADSILSYFQDLFPVIHYVEGVGSNDIGKSSIGYTFQYTGYRPVKATSITGPNYLRIFGTVEPGQCTIIEDEGDNISDDPDKARVLKSGYEHDARIPRINTNTENQEQKWYYVYGYKMILAEKLLRQLKAKGLVDRTFTMKCRPGKIKYAIKEVVSQVINKDEKLHMLYQEMVDFRKLMLCYRLIHYADQIQRIKVNLENRDKELAFPILQLFFGTSCFEEVKEALEFFVKQRRERKSNSLEAEPYIQ